MGLVPKKNRRFFRDSPINPLKSDKNTTCPGKFIQFFRDRFVVSESEAVKCVFRPLLLRQESLLDELLGDLHSVCCCSLAEVVGHTPEVEAGLH